MTAARFTARRPTPAHERAPAATKSSSTASTRVPPSPTPTATVAAYPRCSSRASLRIINIVGNFGTVFVDQSYWQSAIAASPASAHKGYLLGGLVWFTIPALATSLGLAGNALNVALTINDANAGLVLPASATILMAAAAASS